MPGGDSRVDGCRADALVTEVVLDDFEAHAGIKQVRGDGVPQAVAGEIWPEARCIAVAREEGLDASLPQRPTPPGKEWCVGRSLRGKYAAQERRGGFEEHLLAPSSALRAPDQDPSALKVNVTSREERDLTHPQAVVVDEREEREVARQLDHAEEAPDFFLREVARQPQRYQAEFWLGRRHGGGSAAASARNSESVHSRRKCPRA